MNEINERVARRVLDTVDAGLVRGVGKPIPGQMCAAAAGTSAPAATTTSRMLRRIEMPLVSRPMFRSTPQNLRSFDRWWLANASLVRRYYAACEAALRASGQWIAPVDPAADLEAFAETLYQSERWARAQSHACAPLPTRRNEP